MNDVDLLREVIELGVESAAGAGGPFGALVALDGGRVIGRGTNRVVSEGDPTLHAELVAIREAARATFAPVPAFAADAPPIGIAGTVTTLAAIAQSMTTYDASRVHGSSLAVVELERIVASGGAAVAFSMYPVSVSDLIEVANAGGIMPPKSTWFEPKLRDGLLIHLI